MRLGTRWSVGAEPPSTLPEPVVAAVRAVEAELAPDAASRLRWTLTWLERRPRLELDDGTTIELGRDGDAVVSRED